MAGGFGDSGNSEVRSLGDSLLRMFLLSFETVIWARPAAPPGVRSSKPLSSRSAVEVLHPPPEVMIEFQTGVLLKRRTDCLLAHFDVVVAGAWYH